MAHDLRDKQEIPANVRRRINALSAVLEVADLEFEEAREMTMGLSTRPEQVWFNLERAYVVRNPYDRKLSLDIVGLLLPVIGHLPSGVSGLEVYVTRPEITQKLAGLINEYGVWPDRYRLVLQPESLLLGYALEHDPLGAKRQWETAFPLQLLESFGAIWGAPIPDAE
jgi:hypothetical protein